MLQICELWNYLKIKHPQNVNKKNIIYMFFDCMICKTLNTNGVSIPFLEFNLKKRGLNGLYVRLLIINMTALILGLRQTEKNC